MSASLDLIDFDLAPWRSDNEQHEVVFSPDSKHAFGRRNAMNRTVEQIIGKVLHAESLEVKGTMTEYSGTLSIAEDDCNCGRALL